jgi:hypothetical protein
MNHKQAVLLSLACGVFVVAACSLAAAEDAASTVTKEKDNVQVPEIIINGRKETLSQLKAEIYKAEDEFFKAFNEANDKPEYRTYCDLEAPIDSHILQRVCKPQFIDDATEGEAQSVLPFGHPARPAISVINQKMPEYRKYMRDLVKKDPKLRKALGQYYALYQHYGVVFKEKLKGRWFVWN